MFIWPFCLKEMDLLFFRKKRKALHRNKFEQYWNVFFSLIFGSSRFLRKQKCAGGFNARFASKITHSCVFWKKEYGNISNRYWLVDALGIFSLDAECMECCIWAWIESLIHKITCLNCCEQCIYWYIFQMLILTFEPFHGR